MIDRDFERRRVEVAVVVVLALVAGGAAASAIGPATGGAAASAIGPAAGVGTADRITLATDPAGRSVVPHEAALRELSASEKPRANFTVSPRPAIAGKPTTLDASSSTDPDGTVEYYLWDFDGDGNVDRNTTDPVTQYRFSYYESGEGYAVVELTVVDDDGDRGHAGMDVLIERPQPTARCTVSETTVAVGENVTLDASESSNADSYQFDRDQRGSFEGFQDSPTANVSYAEPGTYTPRVRVWAYPSENDDTVDCPSVTVKKPNEPPNASFTFSPDPASPGQRVNFDASASADPDGVISEYRWDFQNDGTVDETTSVPQVDHPFSAAGDHTVRLTVVDNRSATNSTTRVVRVRDRDVACRVSPTSTSPGGSVTVSVRGGENADQFQYDRDSTGSFGAYTENRSKTYTYASPGTYRPRIRVWYYPSEESHVLDCPAVTVEEGGGENRPPDASFSVSPNPASPGETTTFDASGSSDPDGTVDVYRWDFDDDGTVDETTRRPTVTTSHSFPSPGRYTVTLEVEDDDGATDATERVVTVENPLEGACVVEPETVAPGEEVTVDAGGSAGADDYQFDRDAEGDFGEFTDGEPSTTVSYDEPGTYTPRVRVWAYPSEESQVVTCPPVTVRGENLPPNASLTHRPDHPSPGTTVTLDASNSTDPDGRIVEYRWDLDGDAKTDRVTNGSTVTYTYNQTGAHPVGVIVVDDDGATDSDTDEITVVAGGFLPWCPLHCLWVPIPPILVLIWWFLPPIFGVPAPAGIGSYATGTFRTPTDEDRVSVTGLDFEPDLILFAATTNVTGNEDGTPSRTDGWTYGKAHRTGDGITQNVVSVADDARTPGTGVGAAAEDQVIDLPVHGDDDAGGLAGSVSETTDDGFVVSFDDSTVPSGLPDESYLVSFEAYAFGDETDVDVGHFLTPDAPGTQTVDLDLDPNHVVLTASNAVGGVPDRTVTDDVIGVSHGEVVEREVEGQDDVLTQRSVTSVLDPGSVHRNGYAATESGAIQLLHGNEGVTERTSARVTSVEETLELEYDETVGGHLVTYVAVDTGDGREPELGHVRLPATDESERRETGDATTTANDGRVSVDLGFTPGMIEFTACNVDAIGGDRTVDGSPLAFGWSHGVAMPGPEGRVDHYSLHGSLDLSHGTGVTTTAGPGVTGDGTPRRASATDGGTAVEEPKPDVPRWPNGHVAPPVAAVDVVDGAGRILGRDELRVTRVTDTGFELDVSGVDSSRRADGDRDGANRPIVFYKAWPHPAETREADEDGEE